MKNFKIAYGKLSVSVIGLAVITSLAFGMFMPLSANAATLYRQLHLGMRGSDVSDLQAFLATDASVYPQGLVTGYFGNLTAAAVSNYQSKNGLPRVGRVGPQTLALLNVHIGLGQGDQAGPVIGPITITATNVGATITWNTSENSTGTVYYSTSPLTLQEGTTITVGGTPNIANIDLRTTHSATLQGLNANTTYYYSVYVKDAAGNESISWPATFKTTQ